MMTGIFSFECSECGQQHEGSPSFSVNAPDPWRWQTEEIRNKGGITSDICYYSDEERNHYFIRVIIEVPIHGISEPFLWGVWVSLSKESFDHYLDTWDEPDLEKEYFGWFCNTLPYYERTIELATNVHPQAGGARPCLSLHESDHELYTDFVNGISIEKAQKIAEIAMHGISNKS